MPHDLPHDWPQALVAVLDGLGSFVFALSGGLLAVEKRFALFGASVLHGSASIISDTWAGPKRA